MSSITHNPSANANANAAATARTPVQPEGMADRILSDNRLSTEQEIRNAKIKAEHIPVAMADAGLVNSGLPELVVPHGAITRKSTEDTIGKLQSINYASMPINANDRAQIVQNLVALMAVGVADDVKHNLRLLVDSPDSNQLARAQRVFVEATDGVSLNAALTDIVTTPALTAGIPRDTNQMVEAFANLIITFLELSITSAKMKSYSRTLNLDMAFKSADKTRAEGKAGLIGSIVGGVVATGVAIGSAAYTVKGIADEHSASQKAPGLDQSIADLEKEKTSLLNSKDSLVKEKPGLEAKLEELRHTNIKDKKIGAAIEEAARTREQLRTSQTKLTDLDNKIGQQETKLNNLKAESQQTQDNIVRGKQAQVWGQVGTHTLGQVIMSGGQGITGNEQAKIRAESAELRASSETHGARSQEQRQDQDNLSQIVSKLIEILSQFNSTQQSARDMITTKV